MTSTHTTISSHPSSAQIDSDITNKTPKIDNLSANSTPLRQPSPQPNGNTRPGLHHKTSRTTEEYFTGPADIERHSKLPYFLRMHGSITPRMLVPLSFVAIWSTLITLLSRFVYPLVANSLLLTVLGFVVGLGISFRTSSAYERYVDGRRYVSNQSFFFSIFLHVWRQAGQGKAWIKGNGTRDKVLGVEIWIEIIIQDDP